MWARRDHRRRVRRRRRLARWRRGHRLRPARGGAGHARRPGRGLPSSTGLALAEISVAVPFTAVTRAAASHPRGVAGARPGRHDPAQRRAGLGRVPRHRRQRRAGGAPPRPRPAAGRGRPDRPPLAVAGAELDARAAARGGRRPGPTTPTAGAGARRGDASTLFLVAAVGDIDAALVCLRPYRSSAPAELDALQQACNYLSLEVAKQQAVHAIEQRFAGEVLDMVQAGPHREGDVAQRLRAFGVDPTGQIAVLAVAVADAAADESVDLTEAITGFLVDRSLAALVAAGTRETIALVSWPQSLGRSLRALAEDLQRTVDARRRRRPGPGRHRRHQRRVGRPARRAGPGPRDLPGDAAPARRAGRSRRSRTSTTTGCSSACSATTRSPGSPTACSVPCASTTAGAAATWSRRCGPSSSSTAATPRPPPHLHVHVNTLRQRLAKITELTGRDPRRTNDRVDLVLALEADALR